MPAAKPRRIFFPDLLLALVMCAFVLVPLIFTGWGGSRTDVSSSEKRQLADLPAFPRRFGDWKRFPKAFDAFATDRFGFRPQLLDGYKWIVAGLFHDSISPRAFVGRDGWLFVTGSGSLDDMRGADAYTDAELVNAVQQINARGELLAVRRIPFGFVVFPDKHTIYPQYLPPGLYAGFDHRRLNALDEAMSNTGHDYYVDTSDALRADAPASPCILYYKSDTHWNPWGAYLGYRAWTSKDGARLGLKPVDYRFDQFRTPLHHVDGGDLFLMSGYKTHDIGIWPPADAAFHKSRWEVSATTLRRLRTIPSHLQVAAGSGSGNALVIHDSFMDSIAPYVSASYETSWWVWAYPDDQVFGWLVDKLSPDFVLVERVERLTARFPQTDIPAMVRTLGVIGQPASVDGAGRLRIGTGDDVFARPATDVLGAMDQVKRAGDHVSLAGWAKMGAGSPAAVVVVANGKVVGEAPVTLHRADVARSEKNPKLAWSGFNVDVPAEAIREAGDVPQIYFVDFDKYGAYKMSSAFIQRLHTVAEQSK
ncbi:MAG TPA: hypothetical protein VHA71_05145 [Rhodanobacteraceae bacterium]|jgi:hypothetical protein|nr:hypothetical protein [Rhodanobacteraceae bacterium]